MEKVAFLILPILFIVGATSLLTHMAMGVTRPQILQLTCSNQWEDNSTIYVPNMVSTMENISQQIRREGFGVAESGSGPDTSFGLAQCYGDLFSPDCVSCYAEAREILPQCYPFTGGRVFLDGCFMRIENYSFFEEYSGAQDGAICGNRTRKNPEFQLTVITTLLQARSDALKNNGYAKAEMPASGTANESAYVLASCWKTLSASSCRECLNNASDSILECLPWSEGRALNTGCFMRYSDTNFLNPMPRSRESLKLVIAAVASSATVIAVGAFIGAYIWKRRKIGKSKGSNDEKRLANPLISCSLSIEYSILENATDGFDEANRLGQGGFGTVYKGILQDGREIAVKRLFISNKHRPADFYNEVNIISTLEHKNLVKLLGCSSSGPESLLVYEFLPNKSLERFLFDSNKGRLLNWEKRYEIIKGTAEGLVYLHDNSKNRIIHRDIKASNILLDEMHRAKIADFGLARCFQDSKSHISTAIAGTLGYMAPEYIGHGQLTEKADVYSFGVLLLEIVTGRQNNSRTSAYSDSLLNTVWRHFQQQKVEDLFDPNLMLHECYNVSVRNEVLRAVHVGLLCTQEKAPLRPFMSKVLQMLVKKEEHLPAPTKPPFIVETTMVLSDISENQPHASIFRNSEPVAGISSSIFNPR